MSQIKFLSHFSWTEERIKLNKKVLYHFAIFIINNERLINKSTVYVREKSPEFFMTLVDA